MLAASPIPQDLINKHLQMQAQSDLEQARLYKVQYGEIALTFFDRAKVTFRNIADARQLVPLSEIKNAVNQASVPQTPEDESLRQRIAEVYFERAEILKSLGKLGKAQKSYEKAQAWGHEAIPAASTAALTPFMNRAIGLAQSAEFFPSRVSLTSSPKVAQACPQEKHQWVAQVFTTILKQFQDLDLCQSSPSLFLVYAHNNNRLGKKADAEASQRVIQWLSHLRADLYSDRSASGHQALPCPATVEDTAKANDILSSQLCLLPNHAGSVDYVVLCGSELLGHYMASPYYQGFYEAIQRAYQEICDRTDDFTQVEAAIRKVVDANLNEKEFHHVLTELAFLQIRYEHNKDKHGIIPLLLNSTAQQCLPKFIIDSTTIRIEDSTWRTPNMWNGRQTYQDEGLYVGFFKLLKRLLVKQERCVALVEEKIYQACLQKLREDQAHTLMAEEFSLFLNQACVIALDALKQDHSADFRELNIHKAYERILTEIKQINGESLVEPDQLRAALEASYSAKRLAIQRLSGLPLPMEHCYINLAVVEHEKEKASKEEEAKKSKEEATQNHFHRLPSAEAIHSNSQKLVSLEELFEPRVLSKDKTVTPKRILIRGRAGVGKTTLSKKIIFEYTQKGQWRDRFDYVLWIPLRTLKGKTSCDLATLFHEIYFQSHPKGQSLAKTLTAQINGEAKDKTLFVIDGWDEIAQEWGEHEPMSGFLKQLLNQPAVVITSRPYVDLKQADPMELELETVGFSPKNVTAYLDNPTIIPVSQAKQMKHFIQTNAFLQELVNVPIQLDALCYSWDEIKRIQQKVPGAMTVTVLYQAMMNKLWRKDILALGKREGAELLTASHINALSPSRIERVVKTEQDFLSTLAFQGLQNNQIEFHQGDLHALIEQLEAQGEVLPFTLEANLKKISFLRTDDAEENRCSYHFMHLTFQEFLAAKHFVQHWETEREITLLSLNSKQWTKTSPDAFVHQHKYNPRYEIFWWFVSGLLRGEALNRFFRLLEAEPRDLFGAAHQRLLINVLHEASRTPGIELAPTIRDRLEQGLEQWLRLEMAQTGEGTLASVPTFPEHALLQCLKAAKSERAKKKLACALGNRPALSASALAALIALMKDPESWVRSSAADALGLQSSLPASALEALIASIQDRDWPAKHSAVAALAQQSSLPAWALEALIALTKNADRDVKLNAAKLLAHQSLLSASALTALIALTKYPDWQVKCSAACGLSLPRLPASAVEALIALTKDPAREVKCRTADALGQRSSLPASALAALIALTKETSTDVKRSAVKALGQQSSLPAAAVEALIAFTKDADSWLRGYAADALGTQPSLPASALEALIALMKDPDSEAKHSAVKALRKQSSLPASALAALIALTKDLDRWVRCRTADVLGQQSPLPASALEALIRLIKEPDWEVGYYAANALGQQSSLSASAVEVLIALTKETNTKVKCRAADALGQQPSLPASAAEALIALMKDSNWEVKRSTADALGQQSSLPASAVEALSALTRDADGYVRRRAADVLGKQSSLPASALAALIALTKDRNSEVKRSAAKALGKQSSLPLSALAALIALMKDTNSKVKRSAAKALGKQSSLPASALAALIALTKDPDSDAKLSAVKALGKQSPLPDSALEALIALMKDSGWEVKSCAAEVLGQQPSLPAWALVALISLMRDRGAQYSAAKVLAKHLRTLYRLLPRLNSQAIALIYTECLLKQRFDQGAPFYIQEGSLYFYTAQGLQSVPFSDANQEAKFKQAIQQAQQAANLPLALRD